jgi:hypothetical protein
MKTRQAAGSRLATPTDIFLRSGEKMFLFLFLNGTTYWLIAKESAADYRHKFQKVLLFILERFGD